MTLSQLMDRVEAQPDPKWKRRLVREWIESTRTPEEYCILEDITKRHENEEV